MTSLCIFFLSAYTKILLKYIFEAIDIAKNIFIQNHVLLHIIIIQPYILFLCHKIILLYCIF